MNSKNDSIVDFLEDEIFPKIFNGNTILFLGAGFSFTNARNYLGSTIIDYYEEKLGASLETNDLVEFVDRASQLESFSRQRFDQYVKGLLDKLLPEDPHIEVAKLGWRQIITTNMDMMLENAYRQILGTPDEYKEICPVRSIGEYQSSISNDQIKYIKLNGCLSDISKYRMVFSSQDFADNKQFYNRVLSNLSSMSNDVLFLSIGYSYTDGLSNRLLTELNKNNVKNDRKIYNIDPFPNEALIPFLENNNVMTIKLTTHQFFEYYKDWESRNIARLSKKLTKSFYKVNDSTIKVNSKLRLRLNNKIVQLHRYNSTLNLKPENFYRGEDPNYTIVLDNHDVIKQKLTKNIVGKVKDSAIAQNLVPVNFIVGDYGIGKSTAAYRAINELIQKHEFFAFEILDFNGLRPQDLEELFDSGNAENIVLLADNLERHSFFKELMSFRLGLSEHQFNRKISILAPIRENMLEKNLKSHSYKNTNKIHANHELSDSEIDELIVKLKRFQLIRVRDKHEEIKIKRQIVNNYASDPYVTMISLIENSTLIRTITNVLNEINENARIAFEYTSLLYQYKIPMPASILKKIIQMDWGEFTVNILDVDCKGLLINEVEQPLDIKEDLVFRTKHSIISSKYIEHKFKSEDKLLAVYLKIIRALNPNDEHAKLVVDLLKALRKTKAFTIHEKLNKLYDEASFRFLTHPFFNIHYASNLQHRRGIEPLKKAAERLMEVESALDSRNHLITHKRGVIDFHIAKYYHQQKEDYLRDEYLSSAQEFFEIKRAIDPFSSYSFYDLLILEIWKIQNVIKDDNEVLRQHLRIQDLFLKAYETVVENPEFILRLRSRYVNELKSNQFTKAEILKKLEELYANPDTRPMALVFKLNTLESEIFDFGNNFLAQLDSDSIIDELSEYGHLDFVQKAIFDYHCKRLCEVDSRMALNDFNPEYFEGDNFFKYHFYSFIKECYNYQYDFANKHLKVLKGKFRTLHPSLQEYWLDSETFNPKTFTGTIKSMETYRIWISRLGKQFYYFKPSFTLKKGGSYYCQIIFTVRGIRVEIISET